MMKRLYRPEELGRDHDFPETVVLSVVYPSNYRRVSETHLQKSSPRYLSIVLMNIEGICHRTRSSIFFRFSIPSVTVSSTVHAVMSSLSNPGIDPFAILMRCNLSSS
ncbi:hypothetical protein BDE02_03G022500 [Populus trichocarpa]|nr:hypothetical protein BDE02_03G022500 [Populus trichocarpa]